MSDYLCVRRAGLKEDSSNEAPPIAEMPEVCWGAEVKPWAFLSEQKRGPEEPMSMSIGMQLYSLNEVPPAISRRARIHPK